jgi:hypothetical protein
MREPTVLIATVEELRTQGIAYDSSATEFIYKGSTFTRDVTLAKAFPQVAIEYCQREFAAGRLCFLIEEADCLVVWQTEATIESAMPLFDNAP